MYQVNSNSTTPHQAVSRKVGSFPRSLALMSDLIHSETNIAHRSTASTGIWNLQFIDGHVEAASSALAVTQLKSHDNTTGDWPFFKPIMDDLQKKTGN
jgi:hypothetical protein